MSLTFFRLMPWAPSEIGQLKWQLENMNSNTQQSWNATPEKHFVTTKKRKDRHLTDDQLRFGFLYETFVSESGCCVDLIFSLMFSFLMPTWQPHHHLANRVTQLSLTFPLHSDFVSKSVLDVGLWKQLRRWRRELWEQWWDLWWRCLIWELTGRKWHFLNGGKLLFRRHSEGRKMWSYPPIWDYRFGLINQATKPPALDFYKKSENQ